MGLIIKAPFIHYLGGDTIGSTEKARDSKEAIQVIHWQKVFKFSQIEGLQ